MTTSTGKASRLHLQSTIDVTSTIVQAVQPLLCPLYALRATKSIHKRPQRHEHCFGGDCAADYRALLDAYGISYGQWGPKDLKQLQVYLGIGPRPTVPALFWSNHRSYHTALRSLARLYASSPHGRLRFMHQMAAATNELRYSLYHDNHFPGWIPITFDITPPGTIPREMTPQMDLVVKGITLPLHITRQLKYYERFSDVKPQVAFFSREWPGRDLEDPDADAWDVDDHLATEMIPDMQYAKGHEAHWVEWETEGDRTSKVSVHSSTLTTNRASETSSRSSGVGSLALERVAKDSKALRLLGIEHVELGAEGSESPVMPAKHHRTPSEVLRSLNPLTPPRHTVPLQDSAPQGSRHTSRSAHASPAPAPKQLSSQDSPPSSPKSHMSVAGRAPPSPKLDIIIPILSTPATPAHGAAGPTRPRRPSEVTLADHAFSGPPPPPPLKPPRREALDWHRDDRAGDGAAVRPLPSTRTRLSPGEQNSDRAKAKRLPGKEVVLVQNGVFKLESMRVPAGLSGVGQGYELGLGRESDSDYYRFDGAGRRKVTWIESRV